METSRLRILFTHFLKSKKQNSSFVLVEFEYFDLWISSWKCATGGTPAQWARQQCPTGGHAEFSVNHQYFLSHATCQRGKPLRFMLWSPLPGTCTSPKNIAELQKNIPTSGNGQRYDVVRCLVDSYIVGKGEYVIFFLNVYSANVS